GDDTCWCRRIVAPVEIGHAGEGAGARVLAGETNVVASVVAGPDDVRSAGRIQVNFKYVGQAAVGPWHGQTEGAVGADAATGRSVAMDAIGIELDLRSRHRSRVIGGVGTGEIVGNCASDLCHSDVPDT